MKIKNETEEIKQPTTIDETSAFAEAIEEITRVMEKTRIAEYVDYLHHPWRLLWMNFLIGIARGLGSTLGLAIVLGIVVYFLQKVITLNLPLFSDFIAKIVQMVLDNLQYFKGYGG